MAMLEKSLAPKRPGAILQDRTQWRFMDPRFKSYSDWLAARHSSLSRGGLWLMGGEPGRPDPAGFEKARLRILICRLSPYDDVQASITHRVLLSAAQAVPGVYADLAFFPPEADAALMQKDGIPFWLATGSKRAPADFDVVAISLSVQQEALNLPAAMRESGLRLDHAGRMAETRHPLVLLGGHGAGSVPFIHGDAGGPGTGGLVDAVCLGDGIAWLQEFLRRRMAALAEGQTNADFLRALAREWPGTYVPTLYRHALRDDRLVSIDPLLPGIPMPVEFRQDPMDVWLKNYDGAYIPFSEEETEETLPLAAGCAYRCRFCQTGWMRNEHSSASREDLSATAVRFKAAMVNADLNLLASDACSVAGLESILEALCPLFRRVSVKSLSVASLARRPEQSFRLLRRLAKHEFTFGVEGISARLRAYLGKPATAGDLIRIAGSLANGGLRQLKLFFIVTGLEEDRDWAELEWLLKNIHAKVPACRIIASFMPLFHAPFTPLQFAPIQIPPPHAEQAMTSAVRRAGAEFRWSAFPDEISLMNRLCRAGRSATPAVVRFSHQRGLRYYHRLNPGLIRELERELPPCSGETTLHTVFPWSDMRASADVSTLWRSYQKACQELQAAPEPVSAGKPLPSRPPSVPDLSPRSEKPERFFFWARIRPEQTGHPDHVIVRGLLRNLFAANGNSVAAYMGNPLLLRPEGTSGLGLASAEFAPGTRIPRKSDGLEKASVPDIREESIWFGVRWASAAPAKRILETLKQDGVKFQTVRRGTSRWHVVERAFRARTGIAAMQEDDRQTTLFCHRRPAALKKVLEAYPAGVNQVLLAPSDSPCPACRGTIFTALKSISGEPAPACFECLTRPARG